MIGVKCLSVFKVKHEMRWWWRWSASGLAAQVAQVQGYCCCYKNLLLQLPVHHRGHCCMKTVCTSFVFAAKHSNVNGSVNCLVQVCFIIVLYRCFVIGLLVALV